MDRGDLQSSRRRKVAGDAARRRSVEHAEGERSWWRRAVDAKEPPWWVRDIVIAGVLSIVVLWAQLISDTNFVEREEAREQLRAAQAEQLENLRFVRQNSGAGLAAEPGSDGVRPFRGMEMPQIDLDYLDLTGADFGGADLEGASFRGAILTGASFDQNTNLDGTDFTCAFMPGANFSGADLSTATFDRTVLAHATIEFTVVRTTDSDLRGAWLSEVQLWMSGGALMDAHIFGAEPLGSDLSHSELTPTSMAGVEVEGPVKWPNGFDESDIPPANEDDNAPTEGWSQLVPLAEC